METGKEESGIQYKANKYNIISSQDIIFMEIKVALPSGPNSADSCIFVIIIQLVSNAGPSGDDETEVAPRDGENGRGRKASTPRMPPPGGSQTLTIWVPSSAAGVGGGVLKFNRASPGSDPLACKVISECQGPRALQGKGQTPETNNIYPPNRTGEPVEENLRRG